MTVKASIQYFEFCSQRCCENLTKVQLFLMPQIKGLKFCSDFHSYFQTLQSAKQTSPLYNKSKPKKIHKNDYFLSCKIKALFNKAVNSSETGFRTLQIPFSLKLFEREQKCGNCNFDDEVKKNSVTRNCTLFS